MHPPARAVAAGDYHSAPRDLRFAVVSHPTHGLPGLWQGFCAPFRGTLHIAARPRLWPLSIVPTALFALCVVLGLGGAVAAYGPVARRVHAALGQGALAALGTGAAGVLAVLLLAVAVVLLAFVLVPPLAAPFMDALAARVDARDLPEEPVLTQVVRSVRVALAGVLLVGGAQLGFWALTLATPPLAPVWAALAAAVGALGLAYDALDWPLSRRRYGVRARLAWMRAHKGLSAGLALGVWLLSLVPGLSLVLLPAIVVAGVSLVNAAEGVAPRRARARS
jgi:uncharacterized protein involved in cysteine biosynthesis